MFTVEKLAKIHESVASVKFSTAEVAAMRKPAGSTYHVFPFPCPTIGCGDTAPADYDPKSRLKSVFDKNYDADALCEDVRTLVGSYGLETITGIVNNGLDLKLRAIARPVPKTSMKPADKCEYVMNNHRKEALEILTSTPEDQDTTHALVAWYDENVR